MSVIRTVDSEEQKRLEDVEMGEVPVEVPSELFSVLNEVKKTMVMFQR